MQPCHPQALGLWMGCRKWQADSCSIYMYKPTVATTYDSQNFIPARRVATRTASLRKGKYLLCRPYDVTVGDPQANAALHNITNPYNYIA